MFKTASRKKEVVETRIVICDVPLLLPFVALFVLQTPSPTNRSLARLEERGGDVCVLEAALTRSLNFLILPVPLHPPLTSQAA